MPHRTTIKDSPKVVVTVTTHLMNNEVEFIIEQERGLKGRWYLSSFTLSPQEVIALRKELESV